VKTIEVIDGGMLTTVQDFGRFGYQRYGVPTSGALDAFSLRAANRLVGNPDGAAGLEMTLIGPRLAFLAPATIALTGADLDARVDDRPVARWESIVVGPGAVLSFTGPRDGVRGYLAIAGAVDVPVVLGSRATYARSRLGGIDGRPLRAGDVLDVGGRRPVLLGGALRLPAADRPIYGHAVTLRVVAGPQDDRFTARGIDTFLSSPYTVTPQSDRMGYRLAGPAIEHLRGPDIVSDGTPLGAVQVAGDGAPIVLLADRGTAGGYTKIATVIGPDVARLAQAAPGDTVRFTRIDLEAAYQAVRDEEACLARIGPAAPAPGGPARGTARLKKVAAAVAAVASLPGAGPPRRDPAA
jgi:antagonist of KipI